MQAAVAKLATAWAKAGVLERCWDSFRDLPYWFPTALQKEALPRPDR